MTGRELHRALDSAPIPGEHDAGQRSWDVLRTAFAEREPAVRRRRALRPVLVLAALAAIVAAILSPPGRAVLDSVRDAIGVERSQPALFSLPAPGRVLVTSAAGPWIVSADGSKRLLGSFREASWSPFGRFVAASGENELAALEPNGTVRWKIARPSVRFPSWGGTRTDTRIAYLSNGRLRTIAGDGRDEVVPMLPPAAAVAPAWKPGDHRLLAYVTRDGRVLVYDTRTPMLRWSSARFTQPRRLLWSPNGRTLLLVATDRVVLFAGAGGALLRMEALTGAADAAFSPDGRRIAVVRDRDVVVVDGTRRQRVFAGVGRFADIAWSPDGRWLLVTWPDADQWVFVRATDRHQLRAVSNIAGQFEGSFPQLEGWISGS
jgi:hypothetical protein